MKTAKKVFVSVMSMALVAGLTFTGTYAYLTSKDSVTNTFTVGNVAITMDEEVVDVYGVDADENVANRTDNNAYKLIPGHEYKKDPTIHITKGSEEAHLFVKVENGIDGIEYTGDIENVPTIHKQMMDNGWGVIDFEKGIYYYGVVDARNKDENMDIPVFSKFTIDGAIAHETTAKYEDAEVKVTAFAVQADGFENNAVGAWNAAFGSTYGMIQGQKG